MEENEDVIIDKILFKMKGIHDDNPKKGYNILLHEGEENKDFYAYIAYTMRNEGLIRWTRNKEIAFLTSEGRNIIEQGGWLHHIRKSKIEVLLENPIIRGIVLGVITMLIFLIISYFVYYY